MTKEQFLNRAHKVSYDFGYQCELSIGENHNPINEQTLANEASWLIYKYECPSEAPSENLHSDDEETKREAREEYKKLKAFYKRLENKGIKGKY